MFPWRGSWLFMHFVLGTFTGSLVTCLFWRGLSLGSFWALLTINVQVQLAFYHCELMGFGFMMLENWRLNWLEANA